MAKYGDTRIEKIDGEEFLMYNQTKQVDDWQPRWQLIWLTREQLERWQTADGKCEKHRRHIKAYETLSLLVFFFVALIGIPLSCDFVSGWVQGPGVWVGLTYVALFCAFCLPLFLGLWIFRTLEKKADERRREVRRQILAEVGSDTNPDEVGTGNSREVSKEKYRVMLRE